MIVHQSVLLPEVLSKLVPRRRPALMIDATLGEGGHAEAFLGRYPLLSLIGVDVDESILAVARERLAPYAERITLINAWFGAFLQEYIEQAPTSSSWTWAFRATTTRQAAAVSLSTGTRPSTCAWGKTWR